MNEVLVTYRFKSNLLKGETNAATIMPADMNHEKGLIDFCDRLNQASKDEKQKEKVLFIAIDAIYDLVKRG